MASLLGGIRLDTEGEIWHPAHRPKENVCKKRKIIPWRSLTDGEFCGTMNMLKINHHQEDL